jgi:transposase
VARLRCFRAGSTASGRPGGGGTRIGKDHVGGRSRRRFGSPGASQGPIGARAVAHSGQSNRARRVRRGSAGHVGLAHSGTGHEAFQQERPQRCSLDSRRRLRAPTLRQVEPADHAEVLRLLSKRNRNLGRQRSRVICRMHSLCAELVPGGIAKEMYVSDAETLLAKLSVESPAQQMRYDLTLELLDDVRRLDSQIKDSHRRIRMAVKASGTSVTDLYGVGPIHAGTIIGYSGDIRRFANRDAYASYNGTAPVERSSGGRVVHRLSLRGNRKLNHALHMVAVTQIRNPGTVGRTYFERKVADSKTKKEALRSLKRQISNAVYRQLLLDAR